MTLREIAIVLASRLKMEFDEPFVLMTKEIVKLWKDTIIIQRLDSKPSDRMYFVQSIVLDMKAVGDAECSLLGIGEECVMKTVEPIPKLVRTNVLFDYVGAENFRNPYTKASPLALRYINEERNQKGVKFFYQNEYLYTVRSKAEKIGVKTIFAYPERITLCNYLSEGKQECDEEDVEYYCPNDIVQKIIQSVSAVDYRLQVPDQNKEQIKPANNV